MLKIIEWIFSIPIATPGAIIAIGLIIFYSGGKLFNFYNTPWIVVIAYILKHQNLAFQPLKTGLMNISTTLMEAAQVSGAHPLKVWTAIVLPILKPEVLGGFFLVLIPILGELTMSIFLASPVFQSIGTVLFDLQDYADQTSAAALSILLVIFVLCLNQLAWSVSKGKVGY
ncbi:MAG: ABC transporter permease subunit [Deltaproteobacteria bacterium]|nr:ABC transporter permease subunit [Deltaproteobacteria bacterium]